MMESVVTKGELLSRLAREHAQLVAMLAQLTPQERLAPGVVGEWSIKDVLAHLIAHEQRALLELQAAQQGAGVMIDHEATDRFNADAVMSRRAESYEAVRAAWDASYRVVESAVEALSDADFAATSLVVTTLQDSIDGALANNTYEHYAEHRRQIEQWRQRSQPSPSV
jgi:hypothetical protein